MKSKNKRTISTNEKLDKFEDFAYDKINLISFVCSLIIVFFYYNEWFENIKSIIGVIITFTSIVFAVISIFLTLFIFLEDSSLGERKQKYYPEIDKEIYKFLRKTIYATVVTLLVSLIISVVKFGDMIALKCIVGFIAAFSFVFMTIGMIYLIKFSINLALRSIEFINSNTDDME